MTSLEGLCSELGVDVDAARSALRAAERDETAWYVQLVLGIGAWLTAIIGLFFVGFLLDEIFDLEESGISLAVIGIGLFALAASILRRPKGGEFVTQIAMALAVCGAALTSLGLGMQTESIFLATLASLLLAVAAIWLTRSALLQFLLSSFVIVLLEIWIIDDMEYALIDILSVSLPLGAYLSIWPPHRNLAPTAMALFLALPATVLAAYFLGFSVVPSPHWFARLICVATLAGLIFINVKAGSIAINREPALIAISVLALLGAIFLPPGLSSTLIVMFVGYNQGRRSLAIFGALLFGYFLWSFYADLQQTLLVKSVALMLAGVAFLAIRILLARALMRPEVAR